MSTTIRPVSERLAEVGFPYELDRASQFWSVFAHGPLSIPVVAFTEEGVFVGYHTDHDQAVALAARVRRMRGVDGALVITDNLES